MHAAAVAMAVAQFREESSRRVGPSTTSKLQATRKFSATIYTERGAANGCRGFMHMQDTRTARRLGALQRHIRTPASALMVANLAAAVVEPPETADGMAMGMTAEQKFFFDLVRAFLFLATACCLLPARCVRTDLLPCGLALDLHTVHAVRGGLWGGWFQKGFILLPAVLPKPELSAIIDEIDNPPSGKFSQTRCD